MVAREGGLSADSVVLGLQTFFDSGDAPQWTASYELRLGRDFYHLRVQDGQLMSVTRGEAAGGTDATLTCNRMILHALLSKTVGLTAAIASGDLTVSGSTKAVRQLVNAVRKEPGPTATAPVAGGSSRTRKPR